METACRVKKGTCEKLSLEFEHRHGTSKVLASREMASPLPSLCIHMDEDKHMMKM